MNIEFIGGTIITLIFFHAGSVALLAPMKLQRAFYNANVAMHGPPPAQAEEALDEDGQPLTPEEKERRALKPESAQLWAVCALALAVISFPHWTSNTGLAPGSTVNPFLATALGLIAGLSMAAIALFHPPTPVVRTRVPAFAAHPGATTSALLFIWAATISALVAHLFGLF